ncbi:MAG: LLM class flavin-dependent oxidoreductase, partial [Acidimicrobiales bacterium]
MLKLGALLIPAMPVEEIVETIVAAEENGLDYCLVADESLMPDAYVTLAAAARETSRIRIGPVTNGYTRHPAVTAAALASLNELSSGRAIVTLVAGGSMALSPLSIKRDTRA